MLFMYWTNSKIQNPPAAGAWASLYPTKFRVFNDDDVIPLLPAGFEPIYRSIRLPSAKSDLARLLLLRQFGGLYLDAHVGPMSPAHLLETLDDLSTYNVIVFGKGWMINDNNRFDLMNGVLAARRGAAEIGLLINKVIDNIRGQWSKEQASVGHIPYDLFFLSGTYILVQCFFDETGERPIIKADMKDRVHAHFMQDNSRSGFEVAGYYNYREPGLHWSERQRNERYFLENEAS